MCPIDRSMLIAGRFGIRVFRQRKLRKQHGLVWAALESRHGLLSLSVEVEPLAVMPGGVAWWCICLGQVRVGQN